MEPNEKLKDSMTQKQQTKNNEEIITLPMLDAGLGKKPYGFFESQYAVQHMHFYISQEIGEASEYVDMIHSILSAGEHDTIFIHLNCPGGNLDTGVQIINAMQNSPAHVIAVLEGTAYSMGTMIFLSADEMVVNDHCMMMFHNFNGGLVGKGNELTSQLNATVGWFASLAEDIYVPFLSPEEVERIKRGEDIWMQSPEIMKRLERIAAEVPADEGETEAEAGEASTSIKRKPKQAPQPE